MVHRTFQFGISTLMWLVVVAAIHCWLISLGPYGMIVAAVVDKHILVAYLCSLANVDRSNAAADRSIAVPNQPASSRAA
jgi:hypothetical protein